MRCNVRSRPLCQKIVIFDAADEAIWPEASINPFDLDLRVAWRGRELDTEEQEQAERRKWLGACYLLVDGLALFPH